VNLEIALLLGQDGLVNGAIYALLALALILVFTVTRVIFVPQGEFVTFGAMTMAAFQHGSVPGVVGFLMVTGWIAAAVELWTGYATPHRRRSFIAAALFALYPTLLALLLYKATGAPRSVPMQVIATLAVVVPLGAILHRIVFQPMANASVLVLMIAAVALHLLLMGVALLSFGPEGARTEPLFAASFNIGSMTITAQSLTTIAASAILIAALFWAFTFTLRGKALRATAVNSVGARLVGVRPGVAGAVCFGLVSYPIGALGALLVGVIEAFSSFWASAFKEALLFGLIVPILLWLSVAHPTRDETE
jgi:branched-chain amino acid transport system permease protein